MEFPDLSLDKIFKRGAEFYNKEITKINQEKKDRAEFLKKIDEECLEALAKFETLAARLNELNPETIKDPFETHENLLLQKERIDELLKIQDATIATCVEELDRYNFQYQNVQRRQYADINELAEQIKHQLELVESSYRSSVQLLENTIDNERTTIRLAVTKKWEDFFEVQVGHEDLVREKERDMKEYHTREIDRIRLEHEEATRAIRQFLEERDQNIVLDWQQNTEDIFVFTQKENYFKQIAQQQAEENNAVFNMKKRAIRQRVDRVQRMRNRILKIKEKKQAKTKQINQDMRTVHSRILDIEVRSDNAARVNDKLFIDMFNMNEEKCVNLLEKVFQIDRLLTEQQLGLDWDQDNLRVMKREDMPSYKAAMETLKAAPPPGKYDAIAKKRGDTESKKNIISIILKRISDKAGFLVENKLLHLLQHEISANNLQLVILDHVFNALEIHEDDDILLLKEYFEPYLSCAYCFKLAISKDATRGECVHKFVIESPLILKGLAQFVTANISEYDDNLPVTFEARLGKVRNTLSRLLDNQEVHDFFENYRKLVRQDKIKLWENIQVGLNKYAKCLQDRVKLDQECFNLRRQNTELKYMLEKYAPK